MTGTSMDGLDAALVEVRGTGLDLGARVRRCVSRSLGDLSDPLRALGGQVPMSAGQIAELAHDLASLHMAALRELAADGPLGLIAVHGQTVHHAPPRSWQLVCPAPIARALRTTVVCDLRAADLAAGGQGAPITPAADYVLFRDASETRVVVNLGGYANFTLLPRADAEAEREPEDQLHLVRGGDICACNQLLDSLARTCLGLPFDKDGAHAARGRILPGPRAELLPLLERQAKAGRSLGTGDELQDTVRHLARGANGADLVRTACDALAEVLVSTIECAATDAGLPSVDRWLLAGGAVRNQVLVASITQRTSAAVGRVDDYGVPSSHREAAAFAVLGALCQDRVPISLPQITGTATPAPLAGMWVFPP